MPGNILVNGLTAERMLEIEAASVVDGSVDGVGELTLIKHDGSTIDAGNIKGEKGETGATSPPSGPAGGDLGGTYPDPTILKDALPATASMRTLGTGAQQAAAGNDTRLPKGWIAYTPTLTNITIGNGSTAFRYCIVNKILYLKGGITFGSTTSISTNPYISLPIVPGALAGATWSRYGDATIIDSSAGKFMGAMAIRSGSTVRLNMYDGTQFSGALPWTWAATDQVFVTAFYEID